VLQLLAPHLADHRKGLALEQLVSSGELLPAELALTLLAAVPPSCRLLNLYGSTEVAADCSCQDVREWAAQTAAGGGCPWVPVGPPIANTQLLICRSDSGDSASSAPAPEAVAWGDEGEVWVAGQGLAAGYHGRAAVEAAARFRVFAPQQPLGVGGGTLSFVGDGDDGGAGCLGRARRWFRTGDLGRLQPDGESDVGVWAGVVGALVVPWEE